MFPQKICMEFKIHSVVVHYLFASLGPEPRQGSPLLWLWTNPTVTSLTSLGNFANSSVPSASKTHTTCYLKYLFWAGVFIIPIIVLFRVMLLLPGTRLPVPAIPFTISVSNWSSLCDLPCPHPSSCFSFPHSILTCFFVWLGLLWFGLGFFVVCSVGLFLPFTSFTALFAFKTFTSLICNTSTRLTL